MVPPPPLGGMCTCIRGEHLELRDFTKGLHGTPPWVVCVQTLGETGTDTKGLHGIPPPPWVVCVQTLGETGTNCQCAGL